MRRSLIAGAGGLLLIAAVTSACTSDSDDMTPTTATATGTATHTAEATPHTEDAHGAVDPGDLLAAVIHLDAAGFHAMDDALNGDAPEIDPAWLGAAQRARVAVEAVAWPEGLTDAVEAFVTASAALEAALDADDAAAAAPLAVTAHDTQHALSHEAYHAIGEAEPASGGGATLAALVIVGRAGLVEMASTLAGETPAIDAAWLGRVMNARAAAEAVAWPGESQAAADGFIEAATALGAAIESDDVAATASAVEVALQAQSTLATRAYGALSGMRGSASSPGTVLAAIAIIDGAGFHAMDDALNGDAPEVDAAWAAAVTRAKRAAQTVAWPEGVQPAADAFVAAATALETALTAAEVDLAAAAEAAVAAHETQHDLSHDAYAALGGTAGGH
ncbi:MAG: mechanosensitive ion channel protein [Chloroflexota bacterium]